MEKKLWILGVFLLSAVFIASAVIFNIFEVEILPSQFFGALIGVVITAIITVFLLQGQTKAEADQERDSKVFEKKLTIYQDFLQKLCDVIKDDEITKEEAIELKFQIAYIAMHTKSTQIKEISEKVKKIIEKIQNKNNPNPEIPNKDASNTLLSDLVDIVKQFQKELYPDKHGDFGEIGDDIIKNFDSIEDAYVEKEKEHTSSQAIIAPDKLDSAIKTFMQKVKAKVSEGLNMETWRLVDLNVQSGVIQFYVIHKEWNEKEDRIGVFYDKSEKQFFSIRFSELKDYAILYKKLRSEFGGRYNGYQWYMSIKNPYNNWFETSEGISLVQNLDDEMVNYISTSIIMFSNYMEDYYKDWKQTKS